MANFGSNNSRASSSSNSSSSVFSNSSSSLSSSSLSATSIDLASSSPSQASSQSSTIVSAINKSSTSSSATLLSYKNQFFPNFELKYDDSWKVENTTEDSGIDGLLTRNIIFSKDIINQQGLKEKMSFKVRLVPQDYILTGCVPGGEQTISFILKNIDLGNGIYKISTIKTIKPRPGLLSISVNEVIYSKETDKIRLASPDCLDLKNTLTTNIKVSDFPDYSKYRINDGDYVKYRFYIDTNRLKPDSTEIDKVIAASKFE